MYHGALPRQLLGSGELQIGLSQFMTGPLEYLPRFAALDQPSHALDLPEHRHLIGNPAGLTQAVGDQNDGSPLGQA